MASGWTRINQQSKNKDEHENGIKANEPPKETTPPVPAEKRAPVVSTVPLGQLPSEKTKKKNPGKANKREDYLERETVKRKGGGKKWEDKSLLEWDPSHFRLFVGNLSQEVSDETLSNAFSKYPSMSKVRVVRDPKNDFKAKGYGFVAFSDSQDYLDAFKEMNGKYVGNHPVHLKRATTEVKRSTVKERVKNRSKPY